MKEKLAVIVDNKTEITTGDCDGKMCTSACDVAMEMCTPECHGTCGNRLSADKKTPINQRFCDCERKMDVCFCFHRAIYKQRFTPGDRLWGTGDIYFGERILFRKSKFVIRRIS